MLIEDLPDMKLPAPVNNLLFSNESNLVWSKTVDIIHRISPDYDFTLVQSVFEDVIRLFLGSYPGYSAIKTPCHDLSHTLDVFLCGVRLMHGVHASGDHLKDDEITSIMVAMLMHDAGYAQHKSEESGTGAQYPRSYVQRGVEFMRKYFIGRNLPPAIAIAAKGMILGTEHSRPFDWMEFNDERARMLASIVATADIAGQIANRLYLEKLLFLYLEFNEANIGSYQSMIDLLCRTNHFYVMTREKLDKSLGGIYNKLELHLRDMMGVDKKNYLESIEKNMAYLSTIVAQEEAELFATLKSQSVVDKCLFQISNG